MKKIIFTTIIFLFIISITNSQTWVQKLPGISMWSLCKDLQGNIYAGSSGTVKAIYKSTDGGNNWNPILENGASNFLTITIDSLNNIYAANVSNGLMKSTNGGINWTNIPTSIFNGKSVQVVACGKSGYIYVGCISGGLYRSTDFGTTFPDTAIAGGTFVTLVIDKYNPNIIFAGASSLVGLTGLFRSTDAGLTYSATSNTYTCWGVVQKTNLEFYMATTSSGYPFTKSTDGGLNWTTIGSQPGAMRGMTLDIAGNIFICGNGGVFKSTNSGVSFSNAGLTFSGNHTICHQNKIFSAITGTSNGGVWYYVDTTISKAREITGIIPENYYLFQNYPNPFNSMTNIKWQMSNAGNAKITVFDILGKEITILVNGKLEPGTYKITFDADNLPSGIYFYQLKTEGYSETKRMLLLK